MRCLATTLTIISLFLSSCGGANATNGRNSPAADVSASFVSASIKAEINGRPYSLYVPRQLPQGKAPLLLALHGAYGNADFIEEHLKMNPVADRKGFIVAYPNGTLGPLLAAKDRRFWNAGECCGVAKRRNVDDVKYLADMINDIASRYPIDRSRVYITGHSNGAMMSYRFVCERPDLVAGMVGIAGQLVTTNCRSARNVSVLQIHGQNDDFVPSQGGVAKKNRWGPKYRSAAETRQALERSGAKVDTELLPGTGHEITEINSAVSVRYRESLAERIANYLLNKHK